MQQTLTFHSSYCTEHIYMTNNGETMKPIQRMIINGEIICPRCEKEKEDQRVIDNLDKLHDNRNAAIFTTKSLFSDKSLLNASFETYNRNIADGSEEKKNKQLAIKFSESLKDGEKFNIILQGKPGTGKSHLGYSILKHLNSQGTNVSCLFIDFSEMIRDIRKSFKYNDHPRDEFYFIDLLTKVDFLVLDDLGAETGATETEKTATDFVHRILKDVGNGRQDKVTILTTNLSSKSLFKMYDTKTVSRLLKQPEYIIFEKATDKRIAKLPF